MLSKALSSVSAAYITHSGHLITYTEVLRLEPERKNTERDEPDPEIAGTAVIMHRKGLKSGSVAVLLTILFVTVMAALSAIYEAADRKAAVSMAEAAFEIAGRSVLSCYDKELHDRYSLFAFEASEGTVEKRLKALADESLKTATVGRCSTESVSAEAAPFSLMYPENLMLQIREIGKKAALLNNAFDLFSMVSESGNAADISKKSKDDMERLEQEEADMKEAQRERRKEGGSSEEEIDFKEVDNMKSRMKGTADIFKNNKPSDKDGDIVLRNGRVRDNLPSVQAGCNNLFSQLTENAISDLISGGLTSLADDRLITEYADRYFRNKVEDKNIKDTFFKNETEYILYGNMSDKANSDSAYWAIFAARQFSNTAYLYTDSASRNATLAIAEGIAAGIQPLVLLVQAVIIEAWSAVESYNDMQNLYHGRGVPMVKTGETWMTDLDSVLSGSFSMVDDKYLPIPGKHIETYGKYLDMLLMTVSKNTKLYRIMDLIQINMKGAVRQDFMIADHYTGFIMSADVSKKSHASIAPASRADIRMTHTYIRAEK